MLLNHSRRRRSPRPRSHRTAANGTAVSTPAPGGNQARAATTTTAAAPPPAPAASPHHDRR